MIPLLNLGKKILGLSTLLIVLVSINLPAVADQSKVVELPKEEQSKLILSKGQELRIKILSNPSTGYRWHLKSPNEISKCLKVKEETYKKPNTAVNRVGTSGYQIWKVKSKCDVRGFDLLRFEYIREWEVNQTPASWSELLINH